MFEIIYTDLYERSIERVIMYRPSYETRAKMVREALDRLKTDSLVYGFQVYDGRAP